MTLLQLDEKIFFALNRLCHSPLDYVCGWTTLLTTAWLFLPLLWAYMRIWEEKDFGRRYIGVAVAALAGGGAAQIVKLLVDRDRPLSHFYARLADGSVEVRTLFGVYVSASFPSPHAALVFGAAAGLARLRPPGAPAFFAIAALNGVHTSPTTMTFERM